MDNLFFAGIKASFPYIFVRDAERRLLKTGKKFWWGD